MSVGKFLGLVDAIAAIMLYTVDFSPAMQKLKFFIILVLAYKAVISWLG